jgi:hypothetical protein
VNGIWLVLTLAAVAFVTFLGNRLPRWEDWFFVSSATGAQPIRLSWLWENVQGHRVPVSKLIYAVCYSSFGFNSKPILYLHVLLFSTLSVLLANAIQRVRGRWCYTDAFFPIVLLNLGQSEAFLWAQTAAYVTGSCLEAVLLIVIATNRGALDCTGLVLAAASLILLPLTSGGGLVFAAIMVPWLLYQGRLMRRTAEVPALKVHPLALAAAAITVLIIGLYFVGYRALKLSYVEEYVKPGVIAYAKTSVKYLSTAFGGGAVSPFRYLPGFLVVAITLAVGLCLGRVLLRGRLTGEPRAVGLAFFLMACVAVTAVVGLGRYSWGPTVLNSRYSACSVVVLIACYFVWELYAPTFLAPLGRMILFTASTWFLYANLQYGYTSAVAMKGAADDFLRDLRAAEPISRIVARHAGITYYSHKYLEDYLRQLRDSRIAPYDRLPPDRPLRVRMLPTVPTEVHDIDWDHGVGRIRGPEPSLSFALKEPEFVTGLRFRFSQADPEGMRCTMRVGWQRDGKTDLQYYRAVSEMFSGGEAEIVVYIDDRISRVVIVPSSRVTSFRLSKIELLLP